MEEKIEEKTNKSIIEEYNRGDPIHIICTRYQMAPIDLLNFLKGRGIDYKRVFKLEGRIIYNKKTDNREKHTRLIYRAIEELWDSKKSFLTLDDNPRPDVIIIDWENKELIAVEAQVDSSSNTLKASMYYKNNPLKPFDTLILYNLNGKEEIELVPSRIQTIENIYMKCVKCGHRWRLKHSSWAKQDKEYAQCSKCYTDNLIPESLK